MLNTTLIYIERDGEYLMLHRTKKENDLNHDKWIGVGGKCEEDESPEECARREAFEETGLSLGDLRYHGIVTFVSDEYEGEYMHLNEHESARWLDYASLHDVRWLPADEGLLPLLSAELLGVDAGLAGFVETTVIPRYASFDKAHREDHARAVVTRALELAAHYPISRDVVYAAAACHDLGLVAGRETHHLESGRIIREMPELREWFCSSEIEEIAMAAEDHRASSDHEPRGLCGRIIAEADRLIIPMQIIRRTIQFGFSHYPELPREGHWQRTLEHLHEKYHYGGYLKLWIPESPNAAALEELRKIIADEKSLRAIFDRIFDEESNNESHE